MHRQLKFNVIFTTEDEGYSAFVPALPGCVSEGDSFEDAKANIEEAIQLYLEDMNEEEIARVAQEQQVLTQVEIYTH